jgi:LPXTG-motif cell wall-anchored protein
LRDTGNAAINGVNQVLRASAASIGATYVDVTTRFSGHGLCSADPWLVGVNGLSDGTVLHPTAQGHAEGYLPALTAGSGTPAEILAWIADRDQPSTPSAPSTPSSPSATAAPIAGGSGGGSLPVTGTNVWWLVLSGMLLLVAGGSAYRMVRDRRIRTISE